MIDYLPFKSKPNEKALRLKAIIKNLYHTMILVSTKNLIDCKYNFEYF
jgi:hypothetical protein